VVALLFAVSSRFAHPGVDNRFHVQQSGAVRIRWLVACVLVVAPACVRGADGTTARSNVRVVAGLYPLAYVTRLVGGPGVAVTDLTPPGAEPHEIELRPSQVADIERADLVLVVPGLQPAVDDAARDGAILDVTAGLPRLRDADGRADPHVWLDPSRLAAFATTLAKRLAILDEAHGAAYVRRGVAVAADLSALDREYRAGLRDCDRHEVVTSHAAFGYLADRYGLTQVGISGLSPEAEPPPGRIAAVTRFVRAHRVTTVFFESLVSPKVAQTVARETGARTAVLDPVESVTGGDDYPAVMRRNLAALRAALGCR
jgi:zinc transport system substrate-binding protein